MSNNSPTVKGWFFVAIVVSSLSTSARGATITFSAPIPIPTGAGSAAATLFSPGTVVSATDFGAGTQATAEGITFVEHGSNASAATIVQANSLQFTNLAGFHGTDDGVLNAALGGFAADGSPTIIQLQGLTFGTHYQVQLFAVDDRPEGSGGAERQVKFSDGTNSSAQFREGDNMYVLGYFTADAATQNIQSIGLGRPADVNDTGSNFNADVLRVVPEPSSLVLLGLGALGLFAVARRRRKA